MTKEKKTIRKNIDVCEVAVKKIKIKAAKKDTNFKNYVEKLIEDDSKK